MPVTTVSSQVQQNSEAVFEQVLQNKYAIIDTLMIVVRRASP